MVGGQALNMERETYEVENRWRNKYMNLGRELGEIINSQQDRILSLSQENNKLKRELWHLKKSKGRKRQITPKIWELGVSEKDMTWKINYKLQKGRI